MPFGVVFSSQLSKVVLNTLKNRMMLFYKTDPYDFPRESESQAIIFDVFFDILLKKVQRGRHCKVLEIGAGGSTFGNYLEAKNIRDYVEYTAQDVMDRNIVHLKRVADSVIISDFDKVCGHFDVVFSTFVFEHLVEPKAYLNKVDSLLTSEGVHIIICPRYDFPGYICPSLRHLSVLKMLLFDAFKLTTLVAARIIKRFDDFLINTEPAMLYSSWRTDSDAVNIVLEPLVANWFKNNGYTIDSRRKKFTGFKDWIQAKFLLLCIVAKKG